MNTEHVKIIRTNKTITTVAVAVLTLALGLAIGLAAGKSGNSSRSWSASNATTNTLSSAPGILPGMSPNNWNPFQEVRKMQAQMDQMFNQMNQQFMGMPALNGFNRVPGYSLSLNARDLKNKYQVEAYLPDAKASDVHVSLQNHRTLTVRVNSKQTEKQCKNNLTTTVAQWGQYQQEIQLPSPVKAGQMKITRKGHELIITIPKAS